MKYYATITHSYGQFEIGGTKASLIRDMKTMRHSKKIDGLESIRIYAVDLKTGARAEVSPEEEAAIWKEAGL